MNVMRHVITADVVPYSRRMRLFFKMFPKTRDIGRAAPIETSFVRIPRQTDSSVLPETQATTIHWRKIAMLLTPLLLAAGNLIEAQFEKHRAFQVGANKRLEFQGRGEAVRAATLRGAHDRGRALYAGSVAVSKNKAQAEVDIGQAELEAKSNQGDDTSAVAAPLANGFTVALFGKNEDLARLVHEQSELEFGAKYGRYVKVDYKTGKVELQELAIGEQARSELQQRLSTLRSVRRQELNELMEQAVSEGAREMSMFVGSRVCNAN